MSSATASTLLALVEEVGASLAVATPSGMIAEDEHLGPELKRGDVPSREAAVIAGTGCNRSATAVRAK